MKEWSLRDSPGHGVEGDTGQAPCSAVNVTPQMDHPSPTMAITRTNPDVSVTLYESLWPSHITKLLLCTTKTRLMFSVPYDSPRCDLVEEIGCLTVRCVVCGGGGGDP